MALPDHRAVDADAGCSATTSSATTPGRAVVIDSRQVGGRGRDGQALFLLDLAVVSPEQSPVRARVSVAVADDALDAVFPGAELAVELDLGASAPTVVAVGFTASGGPTVTDTPGGAERPDEPAPSIRPLDRSNEPTPSEEHR